MKVAIANDHGGVELKNFLIESFPEIEWANLGTDTTDSTDYPDYGYKLAEAIANGDAQFGVAICGTGIGIGIACNRNKKVRASTCTNATMARLTRIDNDANILCLGARVVGNLVAKDCFEAFINTEFEAGGRHERRVKKLGE
ncbi:MAG: RpiB/LacA/LacB family sugar-phosphate isomerase [Pseudomonadota bacterium]